MRYMRRDDRLLLIRGENNGEEGDITKGCESCIESSSRWADEQKQQDCCCLRVIAAGEGWKKEAPIGLHCKRTGAPLRHTSTLSKMRDQDDACINSLWPQMSRASHRERGHNGRSI